MVPIILMLRMKDYFKILNEPKSQKEKHKEGTDTQDNERYFVEFLFNNFFALAYKL